MDGATGTGMVHHHHQRSAAADDGDEQSHAEALREMQEFHEATGNSEFMLFSQCEKHRTVAAWLSDGSISPDILRECWDKQSGSGENEQGLDIEVRNCMVPS